MTEVLFVLATASALAWPLGHHLARVLLGDPSRLDRWCEPVETWTYRALGVDPHRGMTARGYTRAFLGSNLVLGVAAFLILLFQGWLPLNPDGIDGMSWHLALHTAVSFLTNTNQQHYSGQAQLSYFAQLTSIVGLQVVTPMMGLAVAAAVFRGLTGGRSQEPVPEGAPRDMGNYWSDVVRLSVRAFLPMAFTLALLLAAQGVPSSFDGAARVSPLDTTAGLTEQVIPRGPVAPMVATKQLGTNGGGWYGPNSAMALENPTPVSNWLETVAIVLWPIATVVMVGPLTGRRRLPWLVGGVMAAASVLMIGAALWGTAGATSEGQEVRIGPSASALWATLTTQTSNGSVNTMHDSLPPGTALVALTGMLVNAVWGGIGCGLVQFLVYLLLAVFLSGLMVGRTPEIFGRKLGVREVRWLALLVVLQPVVVLTATALTLGLPGLANTSASGFHGLTQVFYEYTSAFANNGSGFEGLGDGTVWWNLSATLVLLLGRYPALVIPLMVAGSLAGRRVAPEGPGTLRLESPTFALTLFAVTLLLTVLSFLPPLVLGPVGEGLAR